MDDPAPWQALAARMLGTQVELAGFYAATPAAPDIARANTDSSKDAEAQR